MGWVNAILVENRGVLVLGYFQLARLLPVAILQFFKCLVGPNFQTTFAVSSPCINGPKNLWNHIFNFRHLRLYKINLYIFRRFKYIEVFESKSLYRSRAGRHFYGTENEIWAGFGPVSNTEQKQSGADYEQLLRVFFPCFQYCSVRTIKVA